MAVIKFSHWRQYILCQQSFYTAHMQKVLNQIEEYIEKPVKVLKHDRTSTVVVIKIDERLFVVKRANTKGIVHAIRRCFSVSRAARNWHNAQYLLKMHFPTFEPIALLEERFGPLRGRSYLIYPYLEGTLALEYFAYGAKPQPHWVSIIKQIKQLLELMNQQGISHRDLNLSNILLRDHQPWLIDLDAMRPFWPFWGRQRVVCRERARFLANCQDAPGILPDTLALFQCEFSS